MRAPAFPPSSSVVAVLLLLLQLLLLLLPLLLLFTIFLARAAARWRDRRTDAEAELGFPARRTELGTIGRTTNTGKATSAYTAV